MKREAGRIRWKVCGAKRSVTSEVLCVLREERIVWFVACSAKSLEVLSAKPGAL